MNGAPPGSIVVTNHERRTVISPVRTRGSSPARTTLDFPLPDPPDDDDEATAEIVVTETFEQFVDDAVAAEEVGGVGLVERAEPLVRVHNAVGRRFGVGHGGSERGDDVADRWAIGGQEVAQRGRKVAGCGSDCPAPGQAGRDQRGEVASVSIWFRHRRAHGEVGQVRHSSVIEQHARGSKPAVVHAFGRRGFERATDPRATSAVTSSRANGPCCRRSRSVPPVMRRITRYAAPGSRQ